MLAVDTNVLVRYAVKDDALQTALATGVISENRCFVLKSVVLELVWVLSSPAGYALSRDTVTARLRHILGLPTVEVEDAPQVAEALGFYEEGLDFADALHVAGSGELSGLVTFDRRFAKRAAQLEVVPPVRLLE